MYKLNFFVPTEDKERVKEALFAVGVGSYKNYECCSFETLGVGQFKPIGKANPYIGSLEKIEKVQEYKVEMICKEELLFKAVRVLKETHPYEEVAYEIIEIKNI
jgi:hypothetical protein